MSLWFVALPAVDALPAFGLEPPAAAPGRGRVGLVGFAGFVAGSTGLAGLAGFATGLTSWLPWPASRRI